MVDSPITQGQGRGGNEQTTQLEPEPDPQVLSKVHGQPSKEGKRHDKHGNRRSSNAQHLSHNAKAKVKRSNNTGVGEPLAAKAAMRATTAHLPAATAAN